MDMLQDLEAQSRWMIGRVVGMFILPLVVLLPVLLAVDLSTSAQAAMIFFILGPMWIVALVWIFGKMTELFDTEEYFHYAELIAYGLFCGVIFPLIVLLPIYEKVDIADEPRNVLFSCLILDIALWVPIVASLFWVHKTSEHLAANTEVSGKRDSLAQYEDTHEDLKWTLGGLFGFFSVPLLLFLPLYLRVSTSEEGQACLMFFMNFIGLVSFFLILAPRFALLIRSERLTISLVSLEALIKAVTGCIVFPLIIWLPIYYEVDIQHQPSRVLIGFIVGLPSIAILESIRVLFAKNVERMKYVLALAFFGLVFPIGILLPIWIRLNPAATYQIILIGFMLTPPIVAIIGVIYVTVRVENDLPFQPLNYMLIGPWWWDTMYAFIVTIIPICVILPLFFASGMDDLAKWVLFGFMGALVLLLFAMFSISSYLRFGGVREKHDVDELGQKHEAWIEAGPGDKAFQLDMTGTLSNTAAAKSLLHLNPDDIPAQQSLGDEEGIKQEGDDDLLDGIDTDQYRRSSSIDRAKAYVMDMRESKEKAKRNSIAEASVDSGNDTTSDVDDGKEESEQITLPGAVTTASDDANNENESIISDLPSDTDADSINGHGAFLDSQQPNYSGTEDPVVPDVPEDQQFTASVFAASVKSTSSRAVSRLSGKSRMSGLPVPPPPPPPPV